MDDTVCSEYLCGFCTRTEFFVENVTERCALRHVDAKLPEEALRERAADVLEKYVAISREVDRRVANNAYILSMASDAYSKMDAIDRLQQEIVRAGDQGDLVQMKALLRVHGLAIDAVRSTGRQERPYRVCKTCSFFVARDEQCEHPLHSKYAQLRKATERLLEVLGRRVSAREHK